MQVQSLAGAEWRRRQPVQALQERPELELEL
jgi:hypothetical protein